MRQITEQDFERAKWDCDICPLFGKCRFVGTMLVEDCYDDVMAYWKKMSIYPAYGFSEMIKIRG